MPKRLTDQQDAFGHAVWDHYHGNGGFEIIERSDGRFDISGGCNAGRHALYLQQRGLDVLGIDTSPLAIAVAKKRGLTKAEVRSIDELSATLGAFDTILMLGNNFGLFGSGAKARRLLKRFRTLTRPGATLIVETLNVYETKDPDHLKYLAANRARGRMSGQLRLRARYKQFVTPWFDYLMVSSAEMAEIVDGTGWRVAKQYRGAVGRPVYTAIIERID